MDYEVFFGLKKKITLGSLLYQDKHDFYLKKYAGKIYLEENNGRHAPCTYGPLNDEQVKVFNQLCDMEPLPWQEALSLSFGEIKDKESNGLDTNGSI